MKAGADEDRVAILRANGDVMREIGRVEPLQREALFGMIDAVIIDFIQVHFGGRIVDVVFVRRKARPVTAGSVDLDDDEFVGWEIWTDDIHDLAGSVSTATEAANDVFRSDQFGLKFGVRRNAALSNFADGFCREGAGVARGEVEAVRQAVENILALADRARTFAPIYGAAAAEKDERGFFTLREGRIRFAGIQAAGGHAHPFPLNTFA